MATVVKFVVVPITRNGSPISGLTPTIDITEIADTGSDSLVISGATMTELTTQPGAYKYRFAGYTVGKNYSVIVDAGSGQAAGERYYYAGNESFVDEAELVLATKEDASAILDRIDLIEKGPPIAMFE